jgi:hypothetical protein
MSFSILDILALSPPFASPDYSEPDEDDDDDATFGASCVSGVSSVATEGWL